MAYKAIRNHPLICSCTILIVFITSLVTITQFFHPELLHLLRRNPEKLASGEWWRLITPLLVHSDGWTQYVFNIVCITIIGFDTERLYGKLNFLFLYFIGGFTGEIAGYLWEPYGAGASVGLCGLLGGLFVLLLSRTHLSKPFVSILSLYIIVGLISFTLANVYISIGLFALVAILTAIVMKQAHAEKFLGILSSIGGLIGGLILFLYHDIHGAAILGGAFTACILLFLQTKTCN